MSFESVIRADTQWLLDSGGSTVTVYAIELGQFGYDDIPPVEDQSSTVETSTVHIYPVGGNMLKDAKGVVKESTHHIFFEYTSSVAVGHRIREAGASDYYEALEVRAYLDHNEVMARRVEGKQP